MDLDGTIVTETITATLAPLESLEYTFIETIDLSILQDYTLTVSTLVAGDQNTSNDSITITINSLICQPRGNCEDFNDGVTQIALADQNISVQCDGVGFPINRTVINSNLLTLNSNCHNETQQI